MRLSVCIAALACLALASRVAAVSELDMHSLPVETTLLETGETVLAGCWREAKRLCFEQKARCRTECNRIEDELTKGSEESSGSASASSGSSFLQLQMRRAGVLESAPTEIVPRLGTGGAKACPGNKCSSLYQSCYKVHSEACGFRKNDHIKWSSLKDVNSQAEAHRAKCVKKLRNVCRKSRIRCEKECAEDKADSKATGGTEEDACDPAKCKNQYVACREAMQVNEQSNCLQSLVKPQQVPGLFECRDPENCKTPWEKPKAGCADDACAQGASVSGVSSCEGCDKARILCYDECGGKIDGSCDVAKRDCQKEHRQCHYTCPWKKALSIPQADTAGKGGKPLVRAPLKGSQKNCGCLGNDEQCLKKSPCYDPNSVTPVTVPRGSLPQPGLWGQTNGLMASSVKAGKARRDEDRAAAAQAKKEADARVDRLKKWRKQRAQDRKALDKLKTSAQRAADRLRRRHNRHVRRNNTPKGLKTLKQRKPKTGKKNKASKKATGKKARFSQQGDDEAEEQPESEEAPQQEAPQPEAAAPSEESQ